MIDNKYEIIKIIDKIKNIGAKLNSDDLIYNLKSLELLINSSDESNSIIAYSSNRKSVIKLFPHDVFYISTDGRFSTFHLYEGGRYFASRLSLSELEGLWGEYFIKINRNTMVSKSEIKRLDKKDSSFEIMLGSKNEFHEVSRRQAKKIKDMMDERL